MLFAIGTKVRFRFTGETGTIISRLDDDMLLVRLDSDPDLEIPAFEEDLLRNTDQEPNSAGAKFIEGKKDKQPEAPPRREVKAQYLILKPKGLQLCFEPMPGRDGTVSRYKTWLVNDTTHDLLFEFDFYTLRRDIAQMESKVGPGMALELCDMLSDDLNDTPEIYIAVQRITTAGPDTPIERQLKLKAKQFFNSLLTAPILNMPCYHLLLFDNFDPAQQKHSKEETESLKAYTKQKARPRSSNIKRSSPFLSHDVEAYAHFEPEIDLHIENLQPGHARLDKGEILRIQMVHFHRFLDQAIKLGIPRVFIIHGVGEGKLRNAIADELRHHPHVHKFKNEFHHKYGYGATEVIFE
jgi:hypothetical protein